MPTLDDLIQQNLKRLRDQYDTQEEMAQALELTQGQVSNYLNGKGLSQVARLSSRFEEAGISSMELIHRGESVDIQGVNDYEAAVLLALGRTIARMEGRPREKLINALLADARVWADLQDVVVDEPSLRLIVGND